MLVNQRVIQQGHASSMVQCSFAARAAEQRWANRKSSRTPALIILDAEVMGSRTTPLGCILKDTSSTGARIELSRVVAQRWGNSASGLPDRFRLQIPSQLVEMDCRVAWFEGIIVGVQFASPARMLKRPARPRNNAKKPFRISLANLFSK